MFLTTSPQICSLMRRRYRFRSAQRSKVSRSEAGKRTFASSTTWGMETDGVGVIARLVVGSSFLRDGQRGCEVAPVVRASFLDGDQVAQPDAAIVAHADRWKVSGVQ